MIIWNRRYAPCGKSSLACAGLAIMLGGCANPRTNVLQVPVSPQVVQSAVRFRKEYVLVPGDTIEVSVRRSPEVSRTVVIRGDGKISLPLVQDVQAGGLTPVELRDELTRRFSERLVEPDVAVIPVQVRQAMVYVTGDIGSVSVAVPFRDAPTAIQAIAMAGGFRRTSAEREVAIIRLSEDGFLRVIPVLVPATGQPGPYIALRATTLEPDDVIFIPESGRSQFNRFLQDFVFQPLASVNAAIGTYTNFRLVQLFNKE
jgi:polysaccharide export outer membrane protein